MSDVELPPMTHSAGERQTLSEMLDYYRAVLVRKIAGLETAHMAHTLAPSDLTLGGLVFHMAGVEDGWFDYQFMGHDEPEPWASLDWRSDPDIEFRVGATMSPIALQAQFDESVSRSRAIADAASLDQLSVRDRDGERWNLRWIMVHMIEEYARHCGHADLIRESIDGATGD